MFAEVRIQTREASSGIRDPDRQVASRDVASAKRGTRAGRLRHGGRVTDAKQAPQDHGGAGACTSRAGRTPD